MAGSHLRGDVTGEERGNPLPTADRGDYPIAGSVDRKEAVTRVGVAVELGLLAVHPQDRLEFVDVLRRRGPVLVTEQAENRRGQLRQDRHQVGDPKRPVRGWIARDVGAVTIHYGVDLDMAAGKHGLPATRAVPDDSDASGRLRQLPQVVRSCRDVAD